MPRIVRIAGAAIAASGLTMSGCLINSHSRTQYSGRYVSPEAMSRIETGKTRPDFVLATLGEPTCKSPLNDGSEIWKWEYQSTHCGNGSVFLLIDASDHTERQGAAYVMIKDGVVAKKWRD